MNLVCYGNPLGIPRQRSWGLWSPFYLDLAKLCYLSEFLWTRSVSFRDIDPFHWNLLSPKMVKVFIARNAHPVYISRNWMSSLFSYGRLTTFHIHKICPHVRKLKCLVGFWQILRNGHISIQWLGTLFSAKANFSEMGLCPFLAAFCIDSKLSIRAGWCLFRNSGNPPWQNGTAGQIGMALMAVVPMAEDSAYVVNIRKSFFHDPDVDYFKMGFNSSEACDMNLYSPVNYLGTFMSSYTNFYSDPKTWNFFDPSPDIKFYITSLSL